MVVAEICDTPLRNGSHDRASALENPNEKATATAHTTSEKTRSNEEEVITINTDFGVQSNKRFLVVHHVYSLLSYLRKLTTNLIRILIL